MKWSELVQPTRAFHLFATAGVFNAVYPFVAGEWECGGTVMNGSGEYSTEYIHYYSYHGVLNTLWSYSELFVRWIFHYVCITWRVNCYVNVNTVRCNVYVMYYQVNSHKKKLKHWYVEGVTLIGYRISNHMVEIRIHSHINMTRNQSPFISPT